jgi:hypothetical protein
VTDHLTEQQEWDALLASIPTDLPTREAAHKLANLLADAVQAQRPWARQRLNEAMHVGLAKAWRGHVQKQRPKVKTKNGSVKGIGGIRRSVGTAPRTCRSRWTRCRSRSWSSTGRCTSPT